MSNKDLLNNVKKLRELTGVGFKDCKIAIEENNGDLEKSVEFLRKKGIAKASKKMGRNASEGLSLVHNEEDKVAVVEINSETDFVAKNKDFLNFSKEISKINFKVLGDLEKLKSFKMQNGKTVDDNLVALISKMGEKITIRRSKFFDDKNGKNYYYIHSAVEKNVGKIVSVVKISNNDDKDLGQKIAMHIAASSPLAIDKEGIQKKLIDKELEIIKAELINSGKKGDIAEKISKGKINKFISDNTLLNQVWIMDPKKKVSDILKENKKNDEIKIMDFIRFKVGEGIQMSSEFNEKDYSIKMDKTIQAFKKEISTLRTGRANASMLDMIKVDVYGQMMPINQLATISVPEARLITVQVWDKSNVSLIDSSIQKSDLGINPQIDGQIIRIRIPDLTEERRKELIKVLKGMTEKNKVSIRNIRREANEELKKKLKEKKITEDENKNYEKSTQNLTDNHIISIDKITSEKEKEILQL